MFWLPKLIFMISIVFLLRFKNWYSILINGNDFEFGDGLHYVYKLVMMWLKLHEVFE